jgi:hypothetical protein
VTGVILLGKKRTEHAGDCDGGYCDETLHYSSPWGGSHD